MRVVPASVRASWPAPNFEDPPSHGLALIWVTAFFFSLSTVAIVLRSYTRYSLLKYRFGLDDLFAILGYICLAVLSASLIDDGSKNGCQRHVWDVREDFWPEALKLVTISAVTCQLASTFIRSSLLCFYQRLIAKTNVVWTRRAILATHAWNGIMGFNGAIIMLFPCRLDESAVYGSI
ncbi:hypothetical protein MRB53_037551 [Persea americana]|nr:hypothetical protein MRB53_037551 [Persea americana]